MVFGRHQMNVKLRTVRSGSISIPNDSPEGLFADGTLPAAGAQANADRGGDA